MFKMAKKETKKKKTESKISDNRKKIITVLISLVIFAALLIGILSLINKTNDNQSSGLTLDDFYSDDNCRCIEKNRPVCNLEGFEYNATRKLCVNSVEKTVTYPTLTCSKYECSGTVFEFNKEINGWDILAREN